MARPRKAVADRSGPPLAVRLTTAERVRLADEAVRLRLPVSALVRQRALTGTVTTTQARALAAEDRVALNRIGVNLNQIARTLNEHGPRGVRAVVGELHTALARLNGLLLQGADDGP